MAVFECGNRNYNLKIGKYLIGRDTGDVIHDIPIEDGSVDIKHAILEVTSSDMKILDLHSKFGTFINGTRIDWMIFIDVPKKASIKIGDIQCQIKPTSEHDSGFENALNNTEDFEIVPETPQQKGSNNLNDSIVNSSFLVPNTQYAQRKSYENLFDISVQRNIREMEEQDEYYIPETQEVFHKPLEFPEKSNDIIRISMINEDSNLSNASNDLLQDINASIPIPLITHSPVLIPEFVTKESTNNKEIAPRLCNNDDNNSDDETDCEEEMSTLKWNDSNSKSKSDDIEVNRKSPSVTPDLDLDAIGNMNANLEQTHRTKSADDVGSTSVTPDLVIPNSSSNLDEGNKLDDQTNEKSNDGLSNTNKNAAAGNFRQEDEIRNTSVTPDLDLEPTQPFIYHPPESNVRENQIPNTSSNVSPSNKENNSSLAQKYTSDLDQTQKFFSNMPQKDSTNLDKTQVFFTSTTHKNISILDKTQPFIIPTNPASNSKDKSTEVLSTPLKTKSVVKDLFNNEDGLFPTQAFEFKKPHFLTPSFKQSSLRPRSPSPLLLESDDEENNSEFCLKETLVVGEDPILDNSPNIKEKKSEKSNNNKKESRKNRILSSSEDESDKEADNMTELSKKNHEKSSKASRIRTKSTKSSLSSNKSTKSTSSSKSTPVTKSPFDFDLLTPVCDFINLPGINKMEEAGKQYSRVIEKSKISKTLLEETSSEEDDTDDEVFLSSDKNDKSSSPFLPIHNSVNNHKNEEIEVEKSSKQLKDDKKVKTSDKNQKSKNNEIETRKKVKLTKTDEKNEKNKDVSKDDASNSTTLHVSSKNKEPDIKDTEISKDPIEGSKSSKRLKVLISKQKSQNSSSNSKTDTLETSIKVTRTKKLITDELDEKSEEATSSKSLPARRGTRLRSFPSNLGQDYHVKKGKEEEEESPKENKNNQKKKSSNERSDKKSKNQNKLSSENSRKRVSSSSSIDCGYEPPARKANKKSSADIPSIKTKPVVQKKSQNSSSNSKTSDTTEISIKVTRSKKLITDKPDEKSEEATSSKSLPARRGTRLRSFPSNLGQDYHVKKGKEEEEESPKENKNNQKKKSSNERSDKKSKNQNKLSSENSRKRGSSSSSIDCDYEPPAKKTSKKSSADIPPIKTEPVVQRKSSRQPKPSVLFTKVDDAPYRRCLRSRDVEIVSNLKDCTLVVSDKIYRTWKLLGGIAKGVPIVSTSWITALENMRKTDDIPNYYDFLINDIEAEKRFEFCLKESLERANRRPIFKDFCFFITKNTEPSPAQLKEIIKSGTGEILSKFPTTIKENKKVVAISDKRDSHHWRLFRRAAIQIISTEAIMISVLQQKINFNKYTF